MLSPHPAVLPIVRNPSLDVLRAVAILLVFCYHSPGALLINRFGWIGVDLFFVLSGFLVSGLLFREYQSTQQVCAGKFLFRRGMKIYPQFYFFIAATFAIAIFQGRAPRGAQAAAELGFVQNYFPGMWSHTWSLAVEEHFYLLLILAIVMLARNGGENPFRTVPVWIGSTCGLILTLRVLTWKLHPQISDLINVFPSHLRMDSLLIGVLIAYYHSFHKDQLARWMRLAGPWAPPVSMLLLCPVTFLTREDPFMVTIGFSLVAWGFGLLLLSALYPLKVAKTPPRPMVRLGQVSYAFYLWHGPILVACDSLNISMALSMVLGFGASLGMALLTTWLIETPMLRVRDRLTPPGRQWVDHRE
jgi:peptidoglycan/LPS O-acetylase OafA/YrhL